MQLAVDALPQQEAAQPQLSAGPDNQVGLRHIWGVEVRLKLRGGKLIGDIGSARPRGATSAGRTASGTSGAAEGPDGPIGTDWCNAFSDRDQEGDVRAPEAVPWRGLHAGVV